MTKFNKTLGFQYQKNIKIQGNIDVGDKGFYLKVDGDDLYFYASSIASDISSGVVVPLVVRVVYEYFSTDEWDDIAWDNSTWTEDDLDLVESNVTIREVNATMNWVTDSSFTGEESASFSEGSSVYQDQGNTTLVKARAAIQWLIEPHRPGFTYLDNTQYNEGA